MRRWLVIAAVVGGMLLASTGALACDPDADLCDVFAWEDPPAFDPPASEPTAVDAPVAAEPALDPPAPETPTYEPPVVAAAFEPGSVGEVPTGAPTADAATREPATADTPASTDVPAVTAASQAADRGLYLVTEVYAGDYVIRQGDTTTFGSLTVAMDAHTYARLVATVASGEASPLDGLSMNARMTRSDGGGVAGTYRQTFVCDGTGCVSIGFTFFADDSETRSWAASSPASTAAAAGPAMTATTAAPAIPEAGPAAGSTSAPLVTTPSFVEPGEAGGSLGGGGAPGTAPSASVPGPAAGSPRDVRAGVALAPQADVLGAVEVLRGRRVPLWLRATVDGAPAHVLGWRLASGEVVALGPVSGAADDPLVATWRTLAPRGAAFVLRFEVSVDVPGEGARSAEAAIAVVVRSPALVE